MHIAKLLGTALLATAVTLTAFVAAPAGATSTAYWPIAAQPMLPGDPTPDTVDFVVVGHWQKWPDVEQAIATIDYDIPGISVTFAAHCHDVPYAHCVHVKVVDRPNVPWWGLTAIGSNSRIWLNRYYGEAAAPVEHEFIHALGWVQHDHCGLMSPQISAASHPECGELRSLIHAYPLRRHTAGPVEHPALATP